MTGTVPVNKKLLTGTVPVNKELLTGTVPVKNLFQIVNQLLEQEAFIDSYRHFKPETRSFTFRTKDSKKRSRLDYGFISPSLAPYLTNVEHIAHHYENTDHSTISLEIDITNSEIGKGCPPNIHKNLNYQTHQTVLRIHVTAHKGTKLEYTSTKKALAYTMNILLSNEQTTL